MDKEAFMLDVMPLLILTFSRYKSFSSRYFPDIVSGIEELESFYEEQVYSTKEDNIRFSENNEKVLFNKLSSKLVNIEWLLNNPRFAKHINFVEYGLIERSMEVLRGIQLEESEKKA